MSCSWFPCFADTRLDEKAFEYSTNSLPLHAIQSLQSNTIAQSQQPTYHTQGIQIVVQAPKTYPPLKPPLLEQQILAFRSNLSSKEIISTPVGSTARIEDSIIYGKFDSLILDPPQGAKEISGSQTKPDQPIPPIENLKPSLHTRQTLPQPYPQAYPQLNFQQAVPIVYSPRNMSSNLPQIRRF